MAGIAVIQLIFFSPARQALSQHLLQEYGLSSGCSDYKLVETTFRIARNEFACTPKLSVEHFLHSSGFTVKKLEFLASLSNGVADRVSMYEQPKAKSKKNQIRAPQYTEPDLIEEEAAQAPVPLAFAAATGCNESFDVSQANRIVTSVNSLHASVKRLDERLAVAFESLDARVSIIEARMRMSEKLSSPRAADDLTCSFNASLGL
jgi:hypothetical protein